MGIMVDLVRIIALVQENKRLRGNISGITASGFAAYMYNVSLIS